MPSRAEPIEENWKKKHARLPSQMPASCVLMNPDGNKTGADGRSVKPRRRETSCRLKCGQDNNKRANLHRSWKLVAQQREGPCGQHLTDSATLPSVVVKAARA